MERTPIRVRGKRGNKAVVQSNVRSETLSTTSNPSQSPASTNPLKRSASEQELPEPQRKFCKRKLSLLEQLPTELLQSIFLESANASLPAASLRLARALSSRHLFLELSFRAFFKPVAALDDNWILEDDLCWLEPEKFDASTREAPLFKSGVPQYIHYWTPELQTKLLAARFFTWPFFLELVRRAHPVFQQQLIAQRCGRQKCVEGGYLDDKESQWLECDADDMVRDLALGHSRCRGEIPRLPWFKVLGGVPLPSKLVSGPWNDEDECLLLYLNLSGAGRIPPLLLDEKNILPPALPLPTDAVLKAIEAQRCRVVFLFLYDLRAPVNTEMLRKAICVEPFPFNIVQNILWCSRRTATSDLDYHDPTVWKWMAMRQKEEQELASQLPQTVTLRDGISVAKWLRIQLRLASCPRKRRVIGYKPYPADKHWTRNVVTDIQNQCRTANPNTGYEHFDIWKRLAAMSRAEILNTPLAPLIKDYFIC